MAIEEMDVTKEAQARVDAILHKEPQMGFADGTGSANSLAAPLIDPAPEGYHYANRGKRKGKLVKDRSDKGVQRGPKKPDPAPAQAGVLTKEQVIEIRKLIDCVSSCERRERELRDSFDSATRMRQQAEKDCDAYLDSLTRAGE